MRKVMGHEKFNKVGTRLSVVNPMFELYNQTMLDRLIDVRALIVKKYL